MARDAKGRVTYEMVSPGQAFQEHLEKHHNVSAVTPAWLDNTKKKPRPSKLKAKAQEEALNKASTVSKQKSPGLPGM